MQETCNLREALIDGAVQLLHSDDITQTKVDRFGGIVAFLHDKDAYHVLVDYHYYDTFFECLQENVTDTLSEIDANNISELALDIIDTIGYDEFISKLNLNESSISSDIIEEMIKDENVYHLVKNVIISDAISNQPYNILGKDYFYDFIYTSMSMWNEVYDRLNYK